jgi:hypothetical protein
LIRVQLQPPKAISSAPVTPSGIQVTKAAFLSLISGAFIAESFSIYKSRETLVSSICLEKSIGEFQICRNELLRSHAAELHLITTFLIHRLY